MDIGNSRVLGKPINNHVIFTVGKLFDIHFKLARIRLNDNR